MKTDFTLTLNHLLIIGAIIFLWVFFSQPGKPGTTIINNYYDSTTHTIPQTPGNIYISPVINSPQPVPQNLSHIDSVKIFVDYYTKKFDQRTFSDTTIEITVSDSLYGNSKIYSALNYRFKRAIFQETIREKDPVNKVFAGLYATVNDGKVSGGPQLVLLNKKEDMFSVGKSLTNDGLYVSYLLKLRLSKK